MTDADKKLFNKIITRDVTWCFAYDSRTNRQSSEWADEVSPRPKKLKFQKHQHHVDHFFDSQGVMHKEFLPDEKRVNA
jgi:hypothetical protein